MDEQMMDCIDGMMVLSRQMKRMAKEQRAKGNDSWVLTAYHAQLIDNVLYQHNMIDGISCIGDEQFRELED